MRAQSVARVHQATNEAADGGANAQAIAALKRLDKDVIVYRSLAEFHETDVGRFHRWLSLIILAVALAFSAGGVLAWWNSPGEWLLVIDMPPARERQRLAPVAQ